jgi:hypothetical protein
MSRILLFSLALVCCVSLVACGSSMSSSLAGSTTMNNGVPMTLTIGDTPPSGVAVLFFEASITGASLQPSDATKPAVSVLSTPVEVEFGHLQTDTAFLNLAKVPPDTYNSITLTFANPQLTIVNHSMATASSCADNSVCEITPTLSPMTATVSSAPFPITIAQNSVVDIRLDFNVNSSVQPDLSINPTVTIKHVTQRHDSDEGQEIEKLDEIDGQVTPTPTATGFTLMNERSGQSFTISVDANTVYEDFNRAGCTASPADISCVQMGQILNVDLSENGMGSMLAKRVEFESDANKQAIKGIITSVEDATHFHVVVFNEEPTVGGISEGSPVAVTIAANAVFQVGREEIGEVGGFNVSGASFASGADLMVGQDVQIRPGMVSTTGSVPAVTTDLVRLWPSQITGQVGTINTDTGTFTLTMLSPLFTGATPPVTTINVVTFSGMNFMDFPGLGSLTPGGTVSVRGLLFNTPGTPTLVTRAMRMHHGD